ncbi:MAG: hypothetical protein R3A46_15015 [Thermomicrobiales bacterium]
MLRALEIDPAKYTNTHVILRELSDDIGIEHVDGAGRRHKL